MKLIKKLLASVLVIISIMSVSMTSLAAEEWKDLLGTVVDGSTLTDNKESTGVAREEGSSRGYYLSNGSSYISDKGNNVVYISGSTIGYRTADELRVDVHLQRLVNGNWETVAYDYHSEYNTYYAYNGFYITVTPGYFYRTVTNHVAIKGDTVESLTTRTDGLYI